MQPWVILVLLCKTRPRRNIQAHYRRIRDLTLNTNLTLTKITSFNLTRSLREKLENKGGALVRVSHLYVAYKQVWRWWHTISHELATYVSWEITPVFTNIMRNIFCRTQTLDQQSFVFEKPKSLALIIYSE